MSTACERWNPGGLPSWRRPEDGGFDPSLYGVAEVGETGAKAFVEQLHYSHSYPNAKQRYGLYELHPAGVELVGVAVLSVPASKKVLTNVFPHLEPYEQSLELGRFVLVDKVPANGESWFLGEVRRLAAAKGLRGLVSFSDPVPRRNAGGVLVMPGHVGIIYQASNARYLGRAWARYLTVLPDGTVFSDRAKQKIRKQERGHVYAEAELIAWGAPVPAAGEKPAAWLGRALVAAGARTVHHPGNHRYAFTLGNRAERAGVVVDGTPGAYPKIPDPALAA